MARCRSEFQQFLPSHIGAGALLWAININLETKVPTMKFWEEDLEKYSLYTKNDLKKVFESMKVIYDMMDSSNDEDGSLSIKIDNIL